MFQTFAGGKSHQKPCRLALLASLCEQHLLNSELPFVRDVEALHAFSDWTSDHPTQVSIWEVVHHSTCLMTLLLWSASRHAIDQFVQASHVHASASLKKTKMLTSKLTCSIMRVVERCPDCVTRPAPTLRWRMSKPDSVARRLSSVHFCWTAKQPRKHELRVFRTATSATFATDKLSNVTTCPADCPRTL